jgi:outer membrane lipoprotein LolB
MARPVALMLLLAALGGCATAPPPGETAPWQQHAARLAQLADWRASGKLALRSGEAAESASLVWSQQGVHSDLQLRGPMGLSATRIRSDGLTLEITQGEQHRVLDVSTPAAIRENTGWDLPLQALPYWLKGLPSPDLTVQSLELNPEKSLLQSLQQDHWLVLYEDYATFGRYRMPTRLHIRRADTSVRVIIRDWQLPAS